jgi:outer membrane receptor protein involved in Fe transport
VSTVSFACLIGASPALAAGEAAASSDSGAVSEVVVTARRKAENLQEVPLAISAVTGSELKATSSTSLQDVTNLTPGLTYNSGGAEAFAAPVIRGLSDTSGGLASSANVSIFLDGIYIFNPSSIDLSLSGLERVEVVKGPVSGLYGRNAFTGAINYVTTTASQSLHGDLALTYGDYGRAIYAGDLTGPIIPGILAARISGAYDELGATSVDPTSKLGSNGHQKRDVLFSLLFTPNSHITIKPVFYAGNDQFAPATQVFYPVNCGALGESNNYCGDLGKNQIGPLTPSAVGASESGNTRRVFNEHVDIKFDYPVGTFDILAGLNQIKAHNIYDFTGTEYGIPYDIYPAGANNPFAGDPPLPGGPILAKSFYGTHTYEHDRSIEVRYDTPQQYRLRAALGGYYFYRVGYQFSSFGIDGQNIPAGDVLNFIAQGYVTSMGQSNRPLNISYAGTRDLSGFGSLDFDILKNLTLSTAIRYTDEEEKLTNTSTADLRKVFTSITSNSSLRWKPSHDIMVYVDGANGEKSGGFNGAATCPTDLTFQPETDYNVEGGTKATVLGGHLQVNGDVFHTELDNLQVAGPPQCPGAIATITSNFGTLAANGAELEGTYSDHGLTIEAGLAYTDPRFSGSSYDFNDAAACGGVPSCVARVTTVGGLPAVKLQGLVPPNASRWTFNTSLAYRHDIGFQGAEGFFRADYRFESKQFNTVTDFAYYGPRNVVNLHAGVTLHNVTVEGIILNATNDRTPVGSVYNAQLNTFDAPPNGYYGINWNALSYLPDGRTYAVKIAYKY